MASETTEAAFAARPLAVAQTWRREVRDTLILTAPIAAALLAEMGMGVIDYSMSGHLGPTALAAAGLGLQLLFTPMFWGMGAITATGANKTQGVLFSVVPQVVPEFLAVTIFWWDHNVRMSTVLGLVGADPSLVDERLHEGVVAGDAGQLVAGARCRDARAARSDRCRSDRTHAVDGLPRDAGKRRGRAGCHRRCCPKSLKYERLVGLT